MDIGIWIRVSSADQAEGESPKIHEERARIQAKVRGWQVVEVYDLSGISGKTIIEHPEAKRMLADVASGKIKALIFSKLARLGRNPRELLDISDHFEKHAASLVSLGEPIDTSSPYGRGMYVILAALAQMEREEISARVSASVPIRASMGKPTGGRGPFGYHWVGKLIEINSVNSFYKNKTRVVDQKLIPNPDEAPVVKRAYELFLEKGKLLPTCKALNKEGHRARKSIWKPVTLKRILTDTIYKGRRRANYSKSKGNKKSWVLKPEKDWVYHDVIPIVSTDVWDKTNTIIQGWQGQYKKSVPKESKYPYGGILVCECGKKMYCYAYQGMKINRYICQSCKNKINEDVVNDVLVDCLKQMVIRPEQMEQGRHSNTDDLENRKSRLRLVHGELKSINVKIDKLIDLWSGKSIDREAFESRFNGLKERKDQIAFEIPRLQGEIDFINASEAGKERLLKQAETLASMWPNLNSDEQRQIIREILASIIVGKSKLTFNLYYLPEFNSLEKGAQTLRGSWRPPA